MRKKENLLQGSIRQIFFKYLIAGIGGMIGTALYVLTDTLFVANGIGSDGLAALNISIPIMNVFNGLGLLFGIGGATAVSISKGQKRDNQVNQIFTVAIGMSLIVGIIFTLIGVFFLENMARFMGGSGDILVMSKDYLGIIMAFSIGFILNSSLTIFVRNDGAPNLAMFGMLVGTLSNIVLDYIFIFPFKWGMKGAAIATALAPIISLGILSTHFIRRKNTIRFEVFWPKAKVIKRILGNGVPSFITELSAGVVIFAFNIVILRLIGNIGVAAYGIIANLSLICIAIFTGIGQALQPIISINYGAGKKERVRQTLKLALAVGAVFGIVFFAIGMIFPEALTAIFNKDNDAQLASITTNGIYRYFICFLFMGINTVIVSYLQSIEKSQMATVISLLRGLGLVVGGLMFLTSQYGINGVWLTIPFAEILTLILMIILRTVNKSKQRSRSKD